MEPKTYLEHERIEPMHVPAVVERIARRIREAGGREGTLKPPIENPLG